MFEDLLNEASFHGSSVMDVTDLRTLYYGRRRIYVTFTDDSKIEFETQVNEIDRPESILCYRVEDVVGRKVSTSDFYAMVFRIPNGNKEFIDDIRDYTRRSFEHDMFRLRTQLDYLDASIVEDVVKEFARDVRIRYDFARLWGIAEYIAKRQFRDWQFYWRRILIDLGYGGFSDPGGTGILTGKRKPATLYIDFDNREELDILNIQKNRDDPRKRVRDEVARKTARMAGARRRVAKKRKEQTKDQSRVTTALAKELL